MNFLEERGSGFAEMIKIGMPVPSEFIMINEAISHYYKYGKAFPDRLDKSVLENLQDFQQKKWETFGGKDNPLLVSVRSGAAETTPRMMDTVLNLGLNKD